MKKVAGIAIALALWPWPAAQAAAQSEMITNAAFADGRLWLLTDQGDLFSFAEQDGQPSAERVPERTFGLCAREGRPLIVTGKGRYPRRWTLRRREGGGWRIVGTIAADTESFRALDCTGPNFTLLTSRRIVTMSPEGRADAALLSESVGVYRVASMARTDEHRIYVGINGGEWGGGLRRIDRRNGRVEVIDRHPPQDSCAGPLSAACDPVNGITSEPWKADCTAVAIGLVHFEPHGRIVEICGDRVERIFFKPYDSGWPAKAASIDEEPGSTVAFFGLVRSGDSLWAAGIDGLYRFRGPGVPDFLPMPKFRAVGRFHVSFSVPGLVLVVTQIDRHVSVSGGAPMMVAR